MSEGKQEQWFIDHNPILETLQIKILDGANTPVAQVATPIGDWMSNPRWKSSAFTKAHKLAAAPTMYHALLKVKAAMDLEGEAIDLKELYDIVELAIKEATYERETANTSDLP